MATLKRKNKTRKKLQKIHDRTLFENTTLAKEEPIDQLDNDLKISLPNSTIDNNGELFKPRKCYICKKLFTKLHHFYHSHCPECAKRDFEKRLNSTNLKGYRALITGARIKIGYQIALKLLRDGAEVIATTRFPKDAIKRYQTEKDFDQWKDRLKIYYLDLKQLPSVEAFTQYLIKKYPSLEIIINNAAQTIKRPKEYYNHLNKGENRSLNRDEIALLGDWYQNYENINFDNNLQQLSENSDNNQKMDNKIKKNELFPEGKFDKYGEQIDLRKQNSWNMSLSNLDIIEMLEVQFINVTAPAILNSRLKPLMVKSPFNKRFIINVSAMEGQFNRSTKTQFHPHTNMGKAALNMMTRTSAQEYIKDNIYMNSVDTGWVTQEHPYHIKKELRLRGFIPPLDIIDGAARVYDLIVEGLKVENPIFGKFYKDYIVSEW